MDFARNLSGGSQKDHEDFANRYQQGPRAVSDEEAAARYQQVAPNLPPDVYKQSAQDVFSQMTPQQRMQFGQQLIQSAQQQGHSFPDVNKDGIDDRLQEPDYLARTTARLDQQQTGLLGQLLGGLGGIAAYGVSRMLGGGHHHRSRHRGHGFFDFEGPEMNLGTDDAFEGDFGEMDFGGDD